METVCHNQLRFESLFGKEVVADFAGGRITSDAGGLLLRELDKWYGLTEHIADCLHDPRESHKVKHHLAILVRQRLLAIAQGYEDANDAGALAQDPAFKSWLTGPRRAPATWAPSPRLSRFENRADTKDLDATDDPTHGKQQLSFFHGYYEEHMYHPLLVFDGQDGFPLAARCYAPATPTPPRGSGSTQKADQEAAAGLPQGPPPDAG